ncbi:hypothetical protein BOX37_04190 [Nocardia mangyaensis]|uniref:ESAT-6-like protein n=2 Tax=Nocardia mangyaensis TaxID=2213200 RepID=A0A1J0VMN1_9NOCA|nr:hypothetical protein BOX37_04190 [Nocardia mangyaensis]
MATFAKEVEKKHGDLVGAIVKLKGQEDFLTATWQGTARNAFDTFMETYYRQADRMNDQLAQTAESLIKVGSDYEAQDVEYSSRISNQVSSLDLPPMS